MTPLQGIRTDELDAKLLAICNVSYGVREPGPVIYADGYTDLCGFLPFSTPVAMTGGEDGINACLIGSIREGIVVCFRGTIAFDDETHTAEERFLDWKQDFEAPLCEWLLSADCHKGFAAAVDSLDFLGLLPREHPVIFCGHSKGGAMAHLAALKLWSKTGRGSTVTTFGAPRAGGRSFAQIFGRAPIDCRRYEGCGDVVPLVPFSGPLAELFADLLQKEFTAWDYEPVGQQVYVRGSALDMAPSRLRSAVDVALHLRQGGFQAVREAHSIAVDSNYWRGVNGA